MAYRATSLSEPQNPLLVGVGDEVHLYVVPATNLLLLWEAVWRAKRSQTASCSLHVAAAALDGEREASQNPQATSDPQDVPASARGNLDDERRSVGHIGCHKERVKSREHGAPRSVRGSGRHTNWYRDKANE